MLPHSGLREIRRSFRRHREETAVVEEPVKKLMSREDVVSTKAHSLLDVHQGTPADDDKRSLNRSIDK